MPPIEFLTIVPPHYQEQAETLFQRFTQGTGIAVHGSYTTWGSLWRDLVQTGIYKRGPDLSEPGSTWLESLVEMNVLRPFTKPELERMGGENAFIAAAWNGVVMGKENQVWGIPSRVDTRMIYYWKDRLESANLDPQQAFSSLSKLPDTFEKLRTVIDTPWVVSNAPDDPDTIQTLASWVWDVEGEFVTPDGKQVSFMQPGTIEAIASYFDLYRYMPGQTGINGGTVAQMFARREVAVVFSGSWLWSNMLADRLPEEVYSRVGVVQIPAPSFLGGMTLVVFQHTRQEENAVRLIEYLVKPPVQVDYAPLAGSLPSRHASWELPPYSTDPNYRIMYQSMQHGRTFPRVPLWGTVEDRMSKTIGAIWNELLTTGNANTRQVVHKYFAPLASRLNFALDR